LFAQIDNLAGIARLDFVECADIDDSFPVNRNRTVFDRRAIHRDKRSGA
jgi:hypothetical protein